MWRYIVAFGVCAGAFADGSAAAQDTSPARFPMHPEAGIMRTAFMSYEGVRGDIEKNVYENSPYYKKLEMTEIGEGRYVTEIDIPVLWLNREIFLHTEGFEHSEITVNGKRIEAGAMHVLPFEVDITPFITNGINKIEFRRSAQSDAPQNRILHYGQLAYIYSQPKLRIEDFMITAEPDSLNKYGILTIRFALINGYNFPEEINVGYDIYDPKGKLQYYDNRNVVVPGILTDGRDTLELKQFIYGTPANLWSSEKPALYHGMLIVKHGKRIVEYIPYRIGFSKTEVADGKVIHNGKAIEVKAARYNSAEDRKTTAAELSRLKKAGINTIMIDYPQPWWFYEITDETGLYVFDQPGLTFGSGTGIERTPASSLANDPRFAPYYLYLTESMFKRSQNHTSIIGWSLGGEHGNGYNLYKTYRWLKENEPSRPVIYNGADGEWNSDMGFIPAVDAREILDQPASAPAKNARRK